MLAAIRRASPRVSKLAAVRPPGSFSFAWNKNRLIAFISSLRGQMGTLKNYQRYAARCLEQARADPNSKHRLFLIEMAEAWRRLAENANANAGYIETAISEPDRGD